MSLLTSRFFMFFAFFGGVTQLIIDSIYSLRKDSFDKQRFLDQCYQLGVRSFPIVCISAMSTGFVLAVQFGYGLEQFGGILYVPKLTGLTVMRELGPVMTCLMLSGRVGAGIAAEIGAMKVTQQVDAMRALGTDPVTKLIVPRVLALLLMTPLLTILAIFIALMSALILSNIEFNISENFFLMGSIKQIEIGDFILGVGKSVIFALNIGFIACYCGLKTSGGTKGVGRTTTQAVVLCSIGISVIDFFVTKLYWVLL